MRDEFIPPSVEGIRRMLRLIWGWDFDGPHQMDMAAHLVSGPWVQQQAPRRSGKTVLLCALACSYLIQRKQNVIVVMPSLGIGEKVIFFEIDQAMQELEKYKEWSEPLPSLGGKAWLERKVSKKGDEVIWGNGSRLILLTSNQASIKEGLGASLLIYDEAHHMTSDVLGTFLPMTGRARMEGRGQQIINGVGGARPSLIEWVKTNAHGSVKFKCLRLTPDDIVPRCPKYQIVYDELRDLLPAHQYRQHVLCLVIQEGTNALFPNVPLITDRASWLRPTDPAPYNVFFMDSGRVKDKSVLAHVEAVGDRWRVVNCVVLVGIPFPQQAEAFLAYLFSQRWDQYHVGIEVPGMGWGLRDCLKDGTVEIPDPSPYAGRYEAPLHSAQDFDINDRNKAEAAFQMQTDFLQGRGSVSTEAWQAELQGMTYEIHPPTPTRQREFYEFSHSDLFSAVLGCRWLLSGGNYGK